MRFTEDQKMKLIRIINNKIINHPEKVDCSYDYQFLNNRYVFKFSDEQYDIDLLVHRHSKIHTDVEIDVHDKENKRSLIFDTHQYFRNPKDIRILIKLLGKIFDEKKETITDKDSKDADIILNQTNEKRNQ